MTGIGRGVVPIQTCQLGSKTTTAFSRAYHPPSESFAFASSSSLPGSVKQCQLPHGRLIGRESLTSIKRRYFPSISLPKILSLIEGILRGGPLVDVRIVGIRHDDCRQE